MKRILTLWVVFLGALLVSVELFAVDAPFSTTPAPTQVYHAVSSDPSSSQSAPVVQTTAVTPTPTSTVSDSVNGAAVINSVGVDTSLQGQISLLNQTASAFEQRVDQSIQNLNDSNRAMSIAIQSIDQNITQLQQQIVQLQSTTARPAVFSNNELHTMGYRKYADYLNLGGAAVFMLGFGVVLGRMIRRRSLPVVISHGQEKQGKEDTKGDYDFMSTAEAIPAKLDLARSYVVMNDHEQAYLILKTVLEKGNEEQRIQAQLLINKMNSKENDK